MSDELFDPLHARMLADPYPSYARLREQDPVHWHEPLGAWVLTRHDDCLRVLRQADVFSSDPRKSGRHMADSRISMQTTDPPEQSAIRHNVLSALRSADLGAWSRDVRHEATKLLAAIGDRPVDFIADIAEPLALAAMCALYGVPRVEDEAGFRAASRSLVLSMDAGLAPERAEGGLVARELLNELVLNWLHHELPDGLLSRIRDGQESVPRQQMINSVRAIFHAGYASTSSMLGNALCVLAAGSGISSAVLRGIGVEHIEELVRLDSPVQAVTRVCVADLELRGRRLHRGDPVVAVVGAANHDPAVFPDPAVPDYARNPNQHLGFGRGAHSCLGARVGIGVAVTLFHCLADRFDGIEIAATPKRRETATLRGMAELVVSGKQRAGPAG